MWSCLWDTLSNSFTQYTLLRSYHALRTLLFPLITHRDASSTISKLPKQCCTYPMLLSSSEFPHSFLSFHWKVIVHLGHTYSLLLTIEISYQQFPSYSSSAAPIPWCYPPWTFFCLFSVSILVFPCSSHHDIIMFSTILLTYQTAWQVKQRPMDSWSVCYGLWADFEDF